MTLVVADTSPINYLILIGEIEILHSLYESVVIPQEVISELHEGGAPVSV
jgi:predicted nucleic acid-binding protein